MWFWWADFPVIVVDSFEDKPEEYVVDDNDQIVVGYRMNIGFSGDHRVIDGATGAVFLQKLKTILETPSLMLV